MDKTEYRSLLMNLTNVPNLIAEKKEAKKSIQRASRRISTIEKKFRFLPEIVGINSHNKSLEYYLKLYFKDLEYDRVDWLSNGRNEEDLRIWKGKQVIISDVSGTKNVAIKSDHISKVSKYVLFGEKRKSMNGYERKGLFVINHDNGKHYKNRTKNPFNQDIDVYYAEKHGIGLVTTVQLLLGYVKVKSGEIPFEEFHRCITTSGVIEF